MAARIGNVLYWLGCIVAALILIADVAIYFGEGRAHSDGVVFVVFLIAAIISWGIGRAARYILAG
jgi:hypothetical protein